MLAAFAALGYAVSARALLFLALLGAFVIGLEAMASQTPVSLCVLGLYGVIAVVPVAILEIRRHMP